MLVASALTLLFTKINRGRNLTGSFPLPKNSLALTEITPYEFGLSIETIIDRFQEYSQN